MYMNEGAASLFDEISFDFTLLGLQRTVEKLQSVSEYQIVRH